MFSQKQRFVTILLSTVIFAIGLQSPLMSLHCQSKEEFPSTPIKSPKELPKRKNNAASARDREAILKQAEELIDSEADTQLKVRALGLLATIYANLGNRQTATQMFKRTEKNLEAWKSADQNKADDWQLFANAQLKGGYVTEVVELVAALRKTKSGEIRDRADIIAGDTASILTRRGNLKEAHRIALSCATPARIDEAMAVIAQAQAEIGDCEGALRTADRIKDPDYYYFTLCGYDPRDWAGLARTHARRGDLVAALEVLTIATARAKRVKENDVQQTYLSEVARAQAWIGDYHHALESLKSITIVEGKEVVLSEIGIAEAEHGNWKSALQTLAKINTPSGKVYLLSAIALAQAKDGYHTLAKQTLERAITEAKKTKKDNDGVDDWTASFSQIAYAQAKLGAVPDALRVIKSFLSDTQVAHFMDIAKIQAKSGDFDGALHTAHLINTDKMRKAKILYFLASFQVQSSSTDPMKWIQKEPIDYCKALALMGVVEGQSALSKLKKSQP
jgi:tetratricopeptide (TPR) repeat protein